MRGEKRRGRRAERAIILADDDLVEVRIEYPDALAVTNENLLIRFLERPPKMSGPRNRKLATRALNHAALPVADGLDKTRARRLCVAHERAQPLE